VIDAAVNLALAATHLVAETWNGCPLFTSPIWLNNGINYKPIPLEQLLKYRHSTH